MAEIVHVALFDDSKSIRDALGALLGTTPGIGLCGCFPNADRLCERIAACKPEVVLMDIDMPGMNGIQAAALLHKEFPRLPVIMLTVFEDEDRVLPRSAPGPAAISSRTATPTTCLPPSPRCAPEAPP